MGQPRIVQPRPRESAPETERDFSLVLGGPLYQLYLRSGLARPALQLLIRRLVSLSLICWLPPLVFSAIAGHLTGGVQVPFLRDPEVHTRFLLALPLLIASEVYVHQRLRIVIPQFLARGIIAPKDQARFAEIVASAMRMRDSVVAEVVLLVLVLSLGSWFWRQTFTLTASTWYRIWDGGNSHLTAAGWYYAAISLSIFRFILIRWYYRLSIWYRFLWQVRALPLHFNLYHPDRSGGLGFLSASVEALAPVFVSQTVVVAGTIFTYILYAGARLQGFKTEVAGIVIFAVLLLVFPLGFFAIQLERASREAKREFGTLASHYVDDFRRKWVEQEGRTGEPLLGTPDIQSLSDIGNSYVTIIRMRLLPVTRETLVRVMVLIILPLLPLVLTVFSVEEVVHRLFKLVF